MNPAATTGVAVTPFIPCEDYDLSRRFYAQLGFENAFDNGELARFRAGTATFYLQKYRWPDECLQHFMLQLDVTDIEPWWTRAQAVASEFGVRLIPPKDEPWGARIFRIVDPVGVLWHVSQSRS